MQAHVAALAGEVPDPVGEASPEEVIADLLQQGEGTFVDVSSGHSPDWPQQWQQTPPQSLPVLQPALHSPSVHSPMHSPSVLRPPQSSSACSTSDELTKTEVEVLCEAQTISQVHT